MNLIKVFSLILVNIIVTIILINYYLPHSPQPVRVSPDQTYQLSTDERELVDLVQQVNPAVLSIIVSQDVPVYEQFLREFGPFGFRVPDRREVGTQERQVGSGSGFVVSADGLVITNRHVVNVSDAEYVGIDSEGNQYELELIERDSMLDIAVLRIVDAPADIVFLEFGDSDQLQLGQSVVAIGNALGEFSNSVSTGIVSGLSRSIVAGSGMGDTELLENVIQTDAAINPGNSGGPLLNLAGQVVGVNVAVAQGSENIAFSIPANAVQSIVTSISETGRIVRPYLGVRYIMVNEVIAEEFDLSTTSGVLVIGSGDGFAVDPASPAAQAGIREGDVIVSINGEDITDTNSLASVIRSRNVGDMVELEVVRNGEEINVMVELAEFETE